MPSPNSFPSTVATLVAAVDLSSTGAEVLAHSFALAAKIPNAEVFVLHVTAPTGAAELSGSECLDADLVSRVQRLVRGALSLAAPTARLRLGVHVVFGSAATEIARFADHVDAGMVVVGTHARGALASLLLGSVAQDLVLSTSRPVLLVRAPGEVDARAEVPLIEPLCLACAALRMETSGAEMWCDRHSEHHPRAHFVVVDTTRSSKPIEPWGFTHE